jgi:hypothetical protein
VNETADAIEVFRSRAPGLFGLARGAAKAAIVIGEEAAKNLVGGEIGCARQMEFAGKPILEVPHKRSMRPFACGLWAAM